MVVHDVIKDENVPVRGWDHLGSRIGLKCIYAFC